MNYKSVLVAISLITFSIKSEAFNVEVAQWLPWKFIEQELKNTPLSFKLQPRDLTLQWQDWHPLLKGAALQVDGAWTQLQVQSTGINASAQGVAALLKVQQLIVDQTIIKEVGGNRIEIRVKAICEPFEIKVPSADLLAQALYQRQNEMWSPKISQLKLAIHDGWSVSALSCRGPQGFEQAVTQLLQDSLKNPDSIASVLQSFLSASMDEKWNQIWKQMTTVGYQNLKVNSMDEPTEFGFFIRGDLQAGTGVTQINLPQNLEVPTKTVSPQLVLTTEGFTTLAKEKAHHFSILKYNLQSIDAFQQLMHSRFKQFFIWPDLMNFSKSAPFLLTSNPSQKIDLQPLGQGKWSMQSQTFGIIEAPRDQVEQTYLHWGLGASYKLSTQVKDSLLKLHVDQSKTNMTWKFDANYLKKFKPSQRVSSSLLQKIGDSLFTGRSFEVQLPVLDLKTKTLRLNNWTESQGLIWMDWK